MFQIVKMLMLILSVLKNTTTLNTKITNVISYVPPIPPNRPIVQWILLLVSTNIIQYQYCGDTYENNFMNSPFY